MAEPVWRSCSPRGQPQPTSVCRTLGCSTPILAFGSCSSPLLPIAMKSGVCLCVVMAVLAAGALAQPVVPAEATDSMEQRAEETPRRQLRAVLRSDGEPRARLGALLARYIQQVRKGKGVRSPSGFCCASNLDPFSTGREEETGRTRSKIFTLLP